MNLLKVFHDKARQKRALKQYGRKKNFLRDLDYSLVYEAYTKYTLSIIQTTRASLSFPVCVQPLVSVIIPVFNQYKFTMRCLQSILDTTDDVSYEIILADDNSDDLTQTIAERVENITIIKNNGANGFLTNCNNAAQFAKGTYLHFLNNDTQVFAKTIYSLADSLDTDPGLAIVGSKCVLPDSKLQCAGSLWGVDALTYDIGRNDNPLKPEYNIFRYVHYCTGASLMVRRSFWEESGGFDPAFAPGYYEETDLCARAAERGLKVAYQPKSEVIHFEGGTFGEQAKQYMSRNRKIFYNKWKHRLSFDEVRTELLA